MIASEGFIPNLARALCTGIGEGFTGSPLFLPRTSPSGGGAGGARGLAPQRGGGCRGGVGVLERAVFRVLDELERLVAERGGFVHLPFVIEGLERLPDPAKDPLLVEGDAVLGGDGLYVDAERLPVGPQVDEGLVKVEENDLDGLGEGHRAG